MLNIGLSNPYTYFTTTFLESNPVADPDDSILKIVYQRSLESTLNSRNIYGSLNRIGDVGGFSGVIAMIFAIVGNYAATNDMYNNILKKVFRNRSKKTETYSVTDYLFFCIKSRTSKMRSRGIARVTKEVDVINYMRT